MDNNTFFQRIKTELNHWKRQDWSLSDVGDHWDSVEDYDEINEETYSYYRRFTDGYRLSNLSSGSRILDFCSRTGNGTAHFFQNGKVESAVCADVSFRMGKVCRDRLIELGLNQLMWVPVHNFPLPFADQSFDAVLCFETIEHLPRPQELILDIGRVTKTGGTLILTTPNFIWEPVHALAAVMGLHHSEGPHRFLRLNKIKRMVSNAGFAIEKLETTVLVPGGPDFLVRIGVWLEERTKNSFMPLVGLRRIVIGKKL